MSRLRALIWNLNHRARKRRIPAWVAPAIGAQAPDVVILTEYVEGDGHQKFVNAMADIGLAHLEISDSESGHNQVLVAANEPVRRGPLVAPAIHPAVPSNVLHVALERSGLDLVAFRMPAFAGANRSLKRVTWDWLNGAAHTLPGLSLIAGDFNTAPGDSKSYCGDCLESLSSAGWTRASPVDGYSWKHRASGRERQIDHVFCGPAITVSHSEYSWDFRNSGPDAASGNVGCPDHAMLVVDFSLDVPT